MTDMKTIHDPVHGYVEVDKRLLPILDSPEVQRLRYVKQLGFARLVYPGANHTRFEHSLGAMHLARLMAQNLGLDDDDILLAETAALLHDIGHGPYSHASEPISEEYLQKGHEDISGLISSGQIADTMTNLGIDREEVCAMVQGRHRYAGIIHGDLDVDRMDYLLRDAHYTGAPYGTVDAHRLIRSSILSDDSITVRENGISAAESLLIARTLMRPAVYYHHVSRIAETMLTTAAFAHIDMITDGMRSDRTYDTAAEMMRMDDARFALTLLDSECPVTAELTEKLRRRELYKRAAYLGLDQIQLSAYRRDIEAKNKKTIAKAVCEASGLSETDVIIDIPQFPSAMKIDVAVRNNNDSVSLEDISPLIRTLNETRKREWRMGIYTRPEYRKKVETAAYEVLDLPRPTKQNKLF